MFLCSIEFFGADYNSRWWVLLASLSLSLSAFLSFRRGLQFSPDFVWWLVMTSESEFTHADQLNQPISQKCKNGLIWPIFIRLSSNLVQRSLITFQTAIECLKWLRPFFDLPARPTKIDQKWKFSTSAFFIRFGWNLVWRLIMGQKQHRMSLKCLQLFFGLPALSGYQPDQPKPTDSEIYQLMYFLSDLDHRSFCSFFRLSESLQTLRTPKTHLPPPSYQSLGNPRASSAPIN